MFGLKQDWVLEPQQRHFVLEDYEGATPRWCPGCGDTAALTALQKLARDEQLLPEKTVVVSGIGCSSRFPHYMKTYGFHGLHGRALPVATGVRARRPDLNVFVATGDGDCCAIGTAHWVHAVRYNMKMTVMMFDNNIYGLTKMQTSPTTKLGQYSLTHPDGAAISPLAPLSVNLAITNCSFVAQTVDWNPAHLSATLKAAHHHNGFAFIRILQRCPHYMDGLYDSLQRDPSGITFLSHPNGITLEGPAAKAFPTKLEHDPSDIDAARKLAGNPALTPIGLLYRNERAERYDQWTAQGLEMTTEDKLVALEKELDRFLV